MSHDLPDWGALSAVTTIAEITDLGELAARLGSIDTHDRRGDVIFLEDFSSGLRRHETFGSGTGNTVSLSTITARNGLLSARLVAGSDAGRNASIRGGGPFPVLGNLGLEFSFSIAGLTDGVELDIDLFDGINQWAFQIVYDATNQLLKYTNSSGGSTTLASGVYLVEGEIVFHVIKLVFDAANKQFVRLVVDNRVYSMAAIGAFLVGGAAASWLRFEIFNVGRATFNDVVYIDDVIFTQNEPALV